MDVTMASMDALQNYFFWTWKIGNSSVLNTSTSPMWHYQLGLQQGWVPKGFHCVLLMGKLHDLPILKIHARQLVSAGAFFLPPSRSMGISRPPQREEYVFFVPLIQYSLIVTLRLVPVLLTPRNPHHIPSHHPHFRLHFQALRFPSCPPIRLRGL